jgi:hypothetical protein
MTTLPITTLPTTTLPITTVAPRPARSLRQIKAQMAQLRVSTTQAERTVALLQPPTGQAVALAAPAGHDDA